MTLNTTTPTTMTLNTTTPTTMTLNTTTPTRRTLNTTTPTTRTLNTTTPTTRTLNTTTPTTRTLNTTTPTTRTLNTTTPTTRTLNTTTPTTRTLNTTTPTTRTLNTTTPTTRTLNTTTPTTMTPNTTTPITMTLNTTTPTTMTLNTTTPTTMTPNTTTPTTMTLNTTTPTTRTLNTTTPTKTTPYQSSPTTTTPATTTSTTTTPSVFKTTTLSPGSSVILAEQIIIAVNLTVVVEISFKKELKDKTSTLYQTYSKSFHDMIYAKYKSTEGFQSVTIIGFSNGSVECKHKIKFAAGKTVNSTLNSIKDIPWGNETLPLNGKICNVNSVKTERLQKKEFKIALNARICDLQSNCNGYQDCVEDSNDSNGGFVCRSKCSSHDLCGDNGQCLLHPSGNAMCKCLPDSIFEHYGDSCLKSSDLTNILAVTAGAGGAVIIIIAVVAIYVCKKRGATKKSNSNTRHNRVYGSEISMPTRMKNLKANRAYNIGEMSYLGPHRREHMMGSSEYEQPAGYYNGWESINAQPVLPPRMYLPMESRDSPRDYYTSAAHEQRRPPYVEPGDAYRSLDTENQLYIRRPRLSTRHADRFGYRERFV